MEKSTHRYTDSTGLAFNSLKIGLSLLFLLLGTACSNRTHFIPPNRADAIIEIPEVEPENTEKIINNITNETNRNTAQFKLLAQSDIYCGDFISSIYSRRAVTNVWYSTITTATAAAAAIVGGRAAQNLAGTSAVTNEMRSSINNEMYGGELIPTVAKEIAGMRKAELQRILKQQSKKFSEYGGAAAVADAIGYHELCSIPIAISNILARANMRYGANTLDLDASVQKLDSIIATEKARLADSSLTSDESSRKQIRNNIAQLSEQRSNLIRIFAIPGYQSSANEPVGNGGASAPLPVSK